ncbi:MAG: hypothetical protein V1913_10335, partial [Fibrobacterota bacterium]
GKNQKHLMEIIFALIALAAFYIGFRIYIGIRRNRYEETLETAVLRVAVSKLNERGPIVAEQIFSALHGLEENYDFWDYLSGRTPPRVSMEIASVNNKSSSSSGLRAVSRT